jgi:hypothetical protein
LFYVEIDSNTGTFFSEHKLVLQVEGKVFRNSSKGFFNSNNLRKKFSVLLSENSKNVVIAYRRILKKNNKSDNNDDIELVTLNDNLEEILKREITLPYNKYCIQNLDYVLNPNGDLFFLGIIYNDKKARNNLKDKLEDPKFKIQLFFIEKESKNIKITDFNIDGKDITNLRLFADDNNNLICGGYFSTSEGRYTDYDKIIVFKINEKGEIMNNFYYDIPLDIINSNNKNNKISYLKLKELKFNSDGSFVMFGEQEHVQINGNIYQFFYDNILAAKINNNGSLSWIKNIEKKQKGFGGKADLSFIYLTKKDEHCLIYLDNIKNENINNYEQLSQHVSGKGGYITAVKISDLNGELEKKYLLNLRNVNNNELFDFNIRKEWTVVVNDKFIIIELYKGNHEDVLFKFDIVD